MEAGDKVVGYAYRNTFNPGNFYQKTVELSVCVNKDSLHNGSALPDEIDKVIVEHSFTDIISVVASEKMSSVDFHPKHGAILEGASHDAAIKLRKEHQQSILKERVFPNQPRVRNKAG